MTEKIHLMAGSLNSLDNALLAITRPSNHLVFSGRTSLDSAFNEFVLIPHLYFRPWSLAWLFFLPTGGNVLEFDIENGRDRHRVLRSLYGVPEKPHAYIFFGASENDCGIIANHPCYCTEASIDIAHSASFSSRMELLVPGYEENYGRRVNAKAKLFRRLSMEDSLAETEKQIDLLMAMVLELVQRVVPPVERPAWWQDFAAVMTTHDSTTLKGREAAILDVEARKQTIRALVAAYDAERQG